MIVAPPLRQLEEGVFCGRRGNFLTELTKARRQPQESATYCQEPTAPYRRYFRPRAGPWITRPLSRLTNVKAALAHRHESPAPPAPRSPCARQVTAWNAALAPRQMGHYDAPHPLRPAAPVPGRSLPGTPRLPRGRWAVMTPRSHYGSFFVITIPGRTVRSTVPSVCTTTSS